MNIGLPLPHFESEGLEDGNRQHHEGTTDDARIDGFLMTFVHTADKGNTIQQDNQTIHHIFTHFIPEIWQYLQLFVPLRSKTIKKAKKYGKRNEILSELRNAAD